MSEQPTEIADRGVPFRFHRARLLDFPGAVLVVRTYGWWGRTIRRALTVRPVPGLPDLWGNHTAIYIRDEQGVGDSEPLRANVHSLDWYESRMANLTLECRVHIPIGWSPERGIRASDYWMREIHGTYYDFWAFPRLLRKALLGQHHCSEAGKTWARWCTEGVGESYLRGAGLDIYQKRDPTPLTHEKRYHAGLFIDISREVLVPLEAG